MHPLAGQGVNLGFGDVIQLTKALQYAIKTGTDIGSYIALNQEYERPQFKRNELMLAVMEGVYRLYHLNDTFTSTIRGMGMSAINVLPFVKREIMNLAGANTSDAASIGNKQ